MSLVEGEVEAHDGQADLVAEGVRMPLGKTEALGLNGRTPGKVQMGIRAEDVLVEPAGSTDASGRPWVDATVQLLEPIGSDTFVELGIGDATIVARVSPDMELDIGQTVQAQARPSRIHLFDAESGERIGS
jgi:multiple sugar transport system ATP-binding protein